MTMPLENMLGFTGWALYCVMNLLFLLVVLWSVRQSALICYYSVLSRRAMPRDTVGFVMAWLQVLVSLFITLSIAFIFGTAFFTLGVRQTVQVVSFNETIVTFVYRWTSLNQTVSYSDIVEVGAVRSRVTHTNGEQAARGDGPHTIHVVTLRGKFVFSTGTSRWSDRGNAVVHELHRRVAMSRSSSVGKSENGSAEVNDVKSPGTEARDGFPRPLPPP